MRTSVRWLMSAGLILMALQPVPGQAAGQPSQPSQPGQPGQPGQPANQGPGRPGGLSREAAVKMVQAVGRSFKIDGSGLNRHDLAGFTVAGGPAVYFQYVPEERTLRTYALIYKFHRPPKPGVLDGFRAEEKAGTDAGGGTVDYQLESRGLYLLRAYTEPVDDALFVAQTRRLMEASSVWGTKVLERVSAKVFHPAR